MATRKRKTTAKAKTSKRAARRMAGTARRRVKTVKRRVTRAKRKVTRVKRRAKRAVRRVARVAARTGATGATRRAAVRTRRTVSRVRRRAKVASKRARAQHIRRLAGSLKTSTKQLGLTAVALAKASTRRASNAGRRAIARGVRSSAGRCSARRGILVTAAHQRWRPWPRRWSRPASHNRARAGGGGAVTNKQLRAVREWAQAMSYSRRLAPWTRQRYKDLAELVDELLASQAATIALEQARRSVREADYSLGANIVSIDRARRRGAAFSVRQP